MSNLRVDLPYFDQLLALLEKEQPEVVQAFGRHVHWGYWPERPTAPVTPADYAAAAERLTQEVCRAAGVGAGMRVLDAGCGFGGTVASLNERFSDLQLTGVNIDARQLARAGQQVLPQNGNRINWVQADACHLPLEAASVDAVLAVECIFHFPPRAEFFSEARRVLRPGGRLGLSDFVPAGLLGKWGGFRSQGFYGRSDLSCTQASYRQLAEAHGFCLKRDDDLTRGTLPTYSFLRALRRQLGPGNRSAAWQTIVLDFLSRWNQLQYRVLGFEAV